MLKYQFALPIYFDLGATFLYALTGALVTGGGGALLRDGLFIQDGPPIVMKEPRYLSRRRPSLLRRKT